MLDEPAVRTQGLFRKETYLVRQIKYTNTRSYYRYQMADTYMQHEADYVTIKLYHEKRQQI
jgi:hypothetical protein